MFSTNAVPPAPGTQYAPFHPFTEKDPNSSTNQQNSFQSIGFQLPYHKFSPEELRLADYAVGLRFARQYKFGGFANE
jgi:nuclear pore complex protein Nup98-Nup96